MSKVAIYPDRIPDELKRVDRWVVWLYEEVTNGKGERHLTKVPYTVTGNRKASSTDPKTWAAFDAALAAYHGGSWDGIGFIVDGSGLVGVDLDHFRNADTGVIDAQALDIIRRLDSYTEITPSMEGLRCIIRGKLPAEGRKFGPVEMYEAGRFFTITGNHLPRTPQTIHDRGEVLIALHAEVKADYEVRKRIKKDQRIANLWKGDITGYSSQSEADLALCSHLAWLCSRNKQQIDRLFRRSGLYRDKWERADYRDSTLAKALEDTGQPAQASGRRERQDSLPLTDLGNAQRLVQRHGKDLRYCNLWKRWLAWDGRRWAIDETGEIVRRAKETVRSIYAEASASDDEKERKAIAGHATRSESEARIRAMIELAKSEADIPVTPGELDTHPWLFNCQNGTIDLRTGTLQPHRRADLITKQAPVEYHSDAPCPTWEALLTRVMGRRVELVRFLARAFGYSLTGIVSERVLFMLYGSGANGKTTVLEGYRAMLGDYAMRTPTETLLAKRNEGIPSDVARLKGARFVYSSEGEEGRRLAEAKVKDLTGGDTVSARFMHADWFEFQPEFKLWLGTNYKPVVRGNDHGIWDRIKLIPFTVRIPENEQKPRHVILEDLRREWPGILAWAVRGCLEWQRNGLGVPAEVSKATAEYRAEMDVIGEFIEDRCVVEADARGKAGELYASYAAWCEQGGEKPLSQKVFAAKLQERGFVPQRSNASRWWLGLRLLTQVDRDASDAVTRRDARNHISEASGSSREKPLNDVSPCVTRHKRTMHEALIVFNQALEVGDFTTAADAIQDWPQLDDKRALLAEQRAARNGGH